jgi:hypothetical protein
VAEARDGFLWRRCLVLLCLIKTNHPYLRVIMAIMRVPMGELLCQVVMGWISST